MRLSKISYAAAIAMLLLVLYIPARGQSISLTGEIITSTFSKTAPRRFNIKLYPPKTSGKPIQLTTSDAYGRFRFDGLYSASYLLEVYLGKDLVYQEVIALTKTTDRKIDLRRR